jgi:hypothetical protein
MGDGNHERDIRGIQDYITQWKIVCNIVSALSLSSNSGMPDLFLSQLLFLQAHEGFLTFMGSLIGGFRIAEVTIQDSNEQGSNGDYVTLTKTTEHYPH